MVTAEDEYQKCPKCGSGTTREEVDIGVGMMHGPARCNNCGWSQEEEINKLLKEFGIEEES